MSFNNYTHRYRWLSFGLCLMLLSLALLGWRGAEARAFLSHQVSQHWPSLEHTRNSNQPTASRHAANTFQPGPVNGFGHASAAPGTPGWSPAQAGCNSWDTQFGLPDGVNGTVFALATNGPDIFVGGSFTVAGNVNALRVARFNTLTNTWSALGFGGGNGVNDTVYALAVNGNDLYVGGSFTTANVGGPTISANRVARFNLATNTWSALGNNNGNGVSGSVAALLSSGNALYVGGSFLLANVGGPTINANNLAQFNTLTGSWSGVGAGGGSGVTTSVSALASKSDELYVGGSFLEVNIGGTTISAGNIAKVNMNTGVWSTLVAGGYGTNGNIRALVIQGNNLFLGGSFSFANLGPSGLSLYANGVASFDLTTEVWRALGTAGGNGVDRDVFALAVNGNELYVSGRFLNANQGGPVVPVTSLARVNLTTGSWSSLDSSAIPSFSRIAIPPPLPAINTLLLRGTELLVGSDFRMFFGLTTSAGFVAKFETTTNIWQTLGTSNGVDGSIFALSANGAELYVGGAFTFTKAGPVRANRIARFDTLTNTWSVLGTAGGNGVNGEVFAIVRNGNELYVGGDFTKANNGGTEISVNHVAKFNLTTGLWSALGTSDGNGVNGRVQALAVKGNEVFVGGSFVEANVGALTFTANRIAKFNLLTNIWSALGSEGGNGVNGTVSSLALRGTELYVGGSFTVANVDGPSVAAEYLANFNLTTGVWQRVADNNGNQATGFVPALILSGNDLLVGGDFRFIAGLSVNRVARFNTLTRTWSTLGNNGGSGVGGVDPVFDGSYIQSMALNGNELYVAGVFVKANAGGPSVNTRNLAKVNLTTGVWSALAEDGGDGINTNFSPIKTVLAVNGGNVYVGGTFTQAGAGKVSSNLGRYCSNTTLTLTPALGVTTGPSASANNVAIATVNSPSGAPVTITVNDGNAATSNGVTLSQLEVRSNGSVTATVTAAANATNTSFVLRATDNTGFFVETTFSLAIVVGSAGPGSLAVNSSPLSAQKPGSVLVFNIYTSNAAAANLQNTRLSLTNTNTLYRSYVHLFFVDGSTCSVADTYLCLTPNQTASFLASDNDPGTTGYVIAVAVDARGCPTNFNYLIGDEFVKFSSGHAANLGAESITALANGLPFCDETTTTTELRFDGVAYNVLPHVVAADNLAAPADGNNTLLILNRLGGNLSTGAATLTGLFGILYDDEENPVSFSFSPGTCQFRGSLSNNFPRTVPRFEQFIPAGRHGWLKLWGSGLAALTGAVINFNPQATATNSAFNQGHNLHKLTTTNTASYTIPIFPPNC